MAAGLFVAASLRHAADVAVALARGEPPPMASGPPSGAAVAAVDGCAAAMAPTQTAVRALFTGGTFCYEAQLAFIARGLPCRSNAPAARRVAVRRPLTTATSSSTWATTTTRAGARTR